VTGLYDKLLAETGTLNDKLWAKEKALEVDYLPSYSYHFILTEPIDKP